MGTLEELKQCLINIKNNGYSVPNGVEVDDVITDMLKYIGHSDSELRDKLIYSTFNSWTDKGTLSISRMKRILSTVKTMMNLKQLTQPQ